MIGATMKEIAVGQTFSMAKTITETDVYNFAGVIGDFNPAHVNEEYAKTTPFKTRIAHGMLSASLISAAVASQMPGGMYVSQTIKFTAHVHFNDTITATVTVKEVNQERCRAILDTICTNQNGVVVIKGEAVAMPRKE